MEAGKPWWFFRRCLDIVAAEDKAGFRDLMQAHHSLGAVPGMGETVRHVAHQRGRWLALLVFSAPALKCRARDRRIGWDYGVRFNRLHLVTNNARFLILPGGPRNLGSRVLSLCTRRLARDRPAASATRYFCWSPSWTRPVSGAPSTVPPSGNPGTAAHPQSRALDDRGQPPRLRLELQRGSHPHPHRPRSGQHDPAAALRHRPHPGPRARRHRDHAQAGQKPAPGTGLPGDDREHPSAGMRPPDRPSGPPPSHVPPTPTDGGDRSCPDAGIIGYPTRPGGWRDGSKRQKPAKNARYALNRGCTRTLVSPGPARKIRTNLPCLRSPTTSAVSGHGGALARKTRSLPRLNALSTPVTACDVMVRSRPALGCEVTGKQRVRR